MMNSLGAAAGAGGGNNFLIGGLILLAVTTVSRWVEALCALVGQYVFRSVFISVDMDNTQEAFVWVANYLSHLSKERKLKVFFFFFSL